MNDLVRAAEDNRDWEEITAEDTFWQPSSRPSMIVLHVNIAAPQPTSGCQKQMLCVSARWSRRQLCRKTLCLGCRDVA